MDSLEITGFLKISIYNLNPESFKLNEPKLKKNEIELSRFVGSAAISMNRKASR